MLPLLVKFVFAAIVVAYAREDEFGFGFSEGGWEGFGFSEEEEVGKGLGKFCLSIKIWCVLGIDFFFPF